MVRRFLPACAPVLALVFSVFATGCDAALDRAPEARTPALSAPALAVVPSKDDPSALDIAAWNIEWFGSTSNGPTNENTQLANAKDVILGTGADVWGVAEIVDQAHWNSLESQLSGYSGFLASESIVTNGATYYSTSEQKVGLLYKTSVATLVSAKIILTGNDTDFAGRPPLEATLRVTQGGVTQDVVFIVLHAKASNDTASWQRRLNASNALKAYLDATYPTQKVFVVGDFNDDVDVSITAGQASPYQNFVSDGARYTFVTKALSDAGVSSTVSYPDMIDHHLATNEAMAGYVSGSASVYRVDTYISNYATTTSDHYPVLSRFALGGTAPPPPPPPTSPAQVILNEILANEPGSATAGEFVEIVNVGGTAADLSGWTLSDASGTRHTFASGTTLQPGKAIAVFGAASGIPANTPSAIASSTGSLSLSNSSDTVTLRDASGASKNTFTYSSSLAGTDAVSMNRSPDLSATGTFVLHTALNASLKASPGKKASGAGF